MGAREGVSRPGGCSAPGFPGDPEPERVETCGPVARYIPLLRLGLEERPALRGRLTPMELEIKMKQRRDGVRGAEQL